MELQFKLLKFTSKISIIKFLFKKIGKNFNCIYGTEKYLIKSVTCLFRYILVCQETKYGKIKCQKWNCSLNCYN